jgi:CheY-like chemotaxis protein
VYIVAGCACLLCLIIYIVEKNNEKFRRRHNTRELNKLVEMVKEEVDEPTEEVETIVYDEPVLETIEEEKTEVVELLEDTLETKNEVIVVPTEVRQEVQTAPVSIIPEEMKSELIVIEEEKPVEVIEELKEEITTPVVEDNTEILEEAEEELQYTTIEPDQATAKLELQKITEELKKQEQQEVENIALTNYESEQEENAIISLDELIKKGKEMYESNEATQYADEGNEPISLNELAGLRNNEVYEEPFVISDVVDTQSVEEEILEETGSFEPITIAEQVSIEEKQNVRMEQDVVVQTEVKNEVRRFKSSPIISPIYGIENNESVNELELENTANYEKLDEEIKKTNEFIMTLKELQGKLN